MIEDQNKLDDNPGNTLPEYKVEDTWEKREAISANRISRVSAIINIALFIITLAAFWETKRSVDITEESLSAAKIKDSIANYQDSVRFERTDNNTKNAISLSNKSLQSQLDAFQENRKQFEILNKPYIDLVSLKFIDFEVDKPINFIFNLQNLGNYPAVLLKRKIGIRIVPVLPDKPIELLGLNFTKLNIENINQYVKTKPIDNLFFSDQSLTTETYNDLIKQNTFFYFFGEYTYLNVITNKKRTFRFCIYVDFEQFNKDNAVPIKIIYNNNYDK